jgi:hypothetical protein
LPKVILPLKTASKKRTRLRKGNVREKEKSRGVKKSSSRKMIDETKVRYEHITEYTQSLTENGSPKAGHSLTVIIHRDINQQQAPLIRQHIICCLQRQR